MAKRGGDRRAKAAEHGKKVGRPKGQKLPPKPSKADLVVLYEALNRAPKETDSYQVKRWRKRTESEDQNVAHKADTYLIDQVYGKATQPIDHGGSMDHNIVFDMPGPARERKK